MAKRLYPVAPVVLVDDEDSWLRTFKLLLRTNGITNVETCTSCHEARDILRTKPVSVIALDLNMPEVDGEELLVEIREAHPEARIIIVTGVNDVNTAVRCLKHGAFDYFVKSGDPTRLVSDIRRAIELAELEAENRSLQRHLLSQDIRNPDAFAAIITRSPIMLSIFSYVEAVAVTTWPVLITGESGVGKEQIGKCLHELSGREGTFVSVNTAGVDDQLFADSLFGHRKGGFTGALDDRAGLVEQAAGGTLFLDEIGDLSAASQVKLLRLLQTGEYYPLGADTPERTDTRVAAATNRDLEKMRADGSFRKDLYYRLSTHRVQLPPLRKRREDIVLLLEHFIDKASAELGRQRPETPQPLVNLLSAYTFPGNVRELEGMIFDAVSRDMDGGLSMDAFRAHVNQGKISDDDIDQQSDAIWAAFSDPMPSLKAVSDMLTDEALRRAGDNQSIAAQILGISRQALNRRLRARRR